MEAKKGESPLGRPDTQASQEVGGAAHFLNSVMHD